MITSKAQHCKLQPNRRRIHQPPCGINRLVREDMLIHHGRSPFATGAMEGMGSRQSKSNLTKDRGLYRSRGMGSNANSTARNGKEDSYVEDEALVGRGAEGETTAEMDAP
jgi:hypothetical protein